MYQVKINEFEGPMDLLLHLIKKANINIEDINIAEIAEQYLNYIKAMEDLNLDIASEYLVMAAELIELKSRMLLPKHEMDEDETEEELTRESLINRLIDYKKYKEVLPQFKKLEEERSSFFTKVQSDLREYNNGEIVINTEITLSDLLLAYSKFMERKLAEKPLLTKITKKEYDVKERQVAIRNLLHKNKQVSFEELFDKYEKSYVVVTFLAILEMAKGGEIKLTQEKHDDKILIVLGDGNE